MQVRTIRFGLLVGVTGGSVMALWAMGALAATGHGFFTPVNLIAHTAWRGAPLDGRFVPAAFALGLFIHLTISTIVGTVLAGFVERGSLDGGIVFFVAMVVGVVAWVVQAFAWPAVDSTASASFTPWVLAVAHVLFALGAAQALRRLEQTSARRTDGALRLTS
jgi:hypothetical protein